MSAGNAILRARIMSLPLWANLPCGALDLIGEAARSISTRVSSPYSPARSTRAVMTKTSLPASARWLIALCAALVFHLTDFSVQHARAQQAQQAPPSVGVRPAELRGIARSYDFVGRIQAI